MAVIVPLRARIGPWPPAEQNSLTALQGTLERAGLRVAFATGLTDEGDPWASFYTVGEEDSLAHVARRGPGVILVWADGTVLRCSNLMELVATVQRATEHGMVTLRRYR